MPNNNGKGPSWIDTNETDEKQVVRYDVPRKRCLDGTFRKRRTYAAQRID